MTPAAPIGGSSASRNPFSFAARAIGSCFGRRAPDPSEDLKPSPSSEQHPTKTKTKTVLSSSSSSSASASASTSTSASSTSRRSMYGSSGSSTTSRSSMYGSSHGSAKRRSGRGILNGGGGGGGVGNTRELIAQAQPGSVRFSMAEIHRATKNFSPTLKIGQGGFGTVYRGTLDDGMVIAVKRAKKSVDNNHLGVEFQSEIKMLARIEHPSLVRLYGYLEYEDEKIIVVEYVPNGTLRQHLNFEHGSHLDLAARLNIATDVAHAVTYLHMYTDHPIIHRDIKSSNILLTENLRAKVADFGLARLGATKTGATHVSTQVKGTAGYLDPEYLRTCQLTEKSDVYSFGILLVELMSGRRPIEPRRERKERITANWAMKRFMDGDAVLVLDPNLSQSPTTNMALEKILELAFQCLAPTKEGRPSMRKCAEILWSIRKEYKELVSSDSLSQSIDRRKHSNNEEKIR